MPDTSMIMDTLIEQETMHPYRSNQPQDAFVDTTHARTGIIFLQ